MLLIDRYLLRQFAWVFFVFFSSFMGLYIVADLVNNYDVLTNHAAQHGGILRVLSDYYGRRSLSFFDQTSPLLILIASMFTVAAFRRHNEMTALMAAGIPKARIVRPIIVAAAVLTLLAAANREIVLPAMRQQLSYEAKDLSETRVRQLRPQYDNQTNILLDGKGAVLLAREIDQPTFYLPRTLEQYGRQLSARRARYLDADANHPAGYLMLDMKQPADLVRQPSLQLDGKPVVFTPADAPWLKSTECFVVSRLEFERLAGGQYWQQFSSTWELISGLHNPSLDFGADVRVAVHSRLVQPFLDMTLLFLGLPLVLTRENRNLFIAVGLCILVVVLLMLATTACHYLGENLTISPALSAWFPLMLFVPLAVGISQPLREWIDTGAPSDGQPGRQT